MARGNQYLFRVFRQRWEIIGLVLILCIGIPATIWLPEKMVQRVYYGDHSRESRNEYAKLVDDYRKTLVQIIGGAFLLYTLYLTQRRTKAAEETLRTTQHNLELTRKSLEVTRETQITDRFTKAVEQLGATDSQGKKQLEIRFGGIYALERIARDSAYDHWPIMEILTAYVRENEQRQQPETSETESKSISPPDKDIQAVLTVIGRRDKEQDKGRLDLSKIKLQQINLSKASLERAYLRQVSLERAYMREANLREASLREANLERANLEGVTLVGTNLIGANLKGAYLERANLDAANLTGVNLMGANLDLTSLDGAYLSEASLDGAYLKGANLRGTKGLTQEQINTAIGDYKTKLPPGLTYPDHWPKAPNEQSPSTAS